MKVPNFLGGSATTQSPAAANEATINWFPEFNKTPGAKSPVSLYPTPGVEVFAQGALNPVRGMYQAIGRCFVVLGNTFYELDALGALTSRGTVAVTDVTEPVTIDSNGDGGGQLLITSADHGYIFDLGTNAFTEERTSQTRMGAVLDGIFLALDPDTSTLFISDLYDGTTWDALQFLQRANAPDRWRSLIVNGRDIWIHGDETSDVLYNAGTYPFPFALNVNAQVPFGIAAARSSAVVDGVLFWLSQSKHGVGEVVMASGLSPRIVTDHALRYHISRYRKDSRIDDAIGGAYEDQGHRFYVLTFPTANATWTYDLSTDQWSQRGHWDDVNARFNAWRPHFHVQAFGKHLVGDRLSGTIYEMDLSFPNDVDGDLIRRVRRGPVFADENKPLFFSRFEADFEVGLGTATGQGVDPQAMLLATDDGKTWHELPSRSAGAQGEYDAQVLWTRLGSANRRQFELVVTDPIPWRLHGAFAKVRASGGGAT